MGVFGEDGRQLHGPHGDAWMTAKHAHQPHLSTEKGMGTCDFDLPPFSEAVVAAIRYLIEQKEGR